MVLTKATYGGGFRVGERAIVKNNVEATDCIQMSVQPFFNRNCKHERKFVKIDECRFTIEDRIQHPSSFNVISKGNIQFATDISINYQNDTLMLDGVSVHLKGVDEGIIHYGDYAISYHQLQTGLRFKYRASVLSSFTFEFA